MLMCPAAPRLQATGKHFVMDDKFSLGDLMKLGLHNFADICTEIVDRAQKELIVEKVGAPRERYLACAAVVCHVGAAVHGVRAARSRCKPE